MIEKSAEICEVITGWFKAAESGDASWRDAHVSKNPSLRIVGTDPEEWLSGAPAYDFLSHEAATVGGRIKINVRHVEGYSSGDTGWGVALPEITIDDGRKVMPRWSAVFVREDGAWRMIQLHASIAIGNEAAFGDTFVPFAPRD